MTEENLETPPAELREAGKRLWAESWARMQFELHEIPALREACTLADEIADLRKALADDGRTMVKGYAGQQVANPLYAEIRQTIQLQHKLLSSIHISAEGGLKMTRSESGRVAARSRWAAHHG